MTHVDTHCWQVAQTVGHVMLDHMLSSGVMHGDGRRCREEGVKHEVKTDITAVHAWYRDSNGDQWKAAFKMNRGLFEPMVMFFGLTNAPTTFQLMMNHLFHKLIDEGYVTIYMDDILIHTPNDPALHRCVVNDVLRILTVNDLYLKPQKCQFKQTEVEKIIKSHFHGRCRNLQFLVRWKGFPPSEDSWVLESEMSAWI